MRLGIRSRLIVSFVLVIVLPVAIAASVLAYGFTNLQQDLDQGQVDRLQRVNQDIEEALIAGYEDIGDYEGLRARLEPVITEHAIRVQVIDETGTLVFDSQDREASERGEILKPGGFRPGERPQASWINVGSTYRSIIPIYRDNEIAGQALVTAPSTEPPFNIFRTMFTYVTVSAGVGLLSLVGLITLFTWYISRTVLRPLNELNAAADSIARGDLDFRVEYRADDELGRFARAFDAMRARLRESLTRQQAEEQSRKEMVAGISHDLRTPIASIKGYVEGLQDGVVKDEAMFQRYLAVIRDKTDQLDRQIDDLFQFSRLDLDRLEMDLKPQSSDDLLDSVLSALELEMGRDRLLVQRPLPSIMLRADRHRIAQVITNLVENSRRYAGETVRIRIAAEVRDQRLVVSVADNGPGISEEDLPHIFERFYRGEKSRSREHGGAGLGLAIAKHIIEAHGGEIWAESVRGKGSVFCFALPITHPQATT